MPDWKRLWFINTQPFNVYGRDTNVDQITSYNNEVLEINGEEMR